MIETLQDAIIKRMMRSKFGAFSISDFIDLAGHDAVRKTLDRLEDNGQIRRVIRGIYDRPKFNRRFNMFEAPRVEEVAKALARQYNWTICPSGNLSLNLLGLSTQVPARYVFVSNGPYATYMIEGTELIFKHTNNREISSFSFITQLLIQAIKTIGRENVLLDDILHLRRFLKPREKSILIKEGKKTSIWIYEVIKEICEV